MRRANIIGEAYYMMKTERDIGNIMIIFLMYFTRSQCKVLVGNPEGMQPLVHGRTLLNYILKKKYVRASYLRKGGKFLDWLSTEF